MITLQELRSWNTDEETTILLDYLEEHGVEGVDKLTIHKFFEEENYFHCTCLSCFNITLKFMRDSKSPGFKCHEWQQEIPIGVSKIVKRWVESKFKELCCASSI